MISMLVLGAIVYIAGAALTSWLLGLNGETFDSPGAVPVALFWPITGPFVGTIFFLDIVNKHGLDFFQRRQTKKSQDSNGKTT